MHFHVWFVTKYRKVTLEGEIERKAKDAFSEIVRNKKYNILEMETNRDHVHMLVEASGKKDLSAMVRTLKAVSAKRILEETPLLRVGNVRHFWARRYGYKEVLPKDIEAIREYIRKQKETPHLRVGNVQSHEEAQP